MGRYHGSGRQGRDRRVWGRVSGREVDGVEMLVAAESLDGLTAASGGWVALPGFDEYLLGYKDRSLMVDAEHMTAIIPGGNGIFRSTLVRDGRVMGTWKRALTKKAVKVEVIEVQRVTKAERKRAEAALQPFAEFVERDLQVTWTLGVAARAQPPIL